MSAPFAYECCAAPHTAKFASNARKPFPRINLYVLAGKKFHHRKSANVPEFPACYRRFPGCSRRFPGCSRRFPGLFPGCSRICFWVWLKSSPDKPKRFEDFHATHGTKSHQQIFTDATVCYRYTIAKFKIIFPICQTLFVCDLSFGVLAPK